MPPSSRATYLQPAAVAWIHTPSRLASHPGGMWSGGGGGGLFTSGGGKGLGQAATATAHTAKKRHRTAQNVTGTPGQCYPFALMRRALLPLCLLLAVPALAQTEDDLLSPLPP